jgi:gliding motility-associated protein GldL
MSSKKGGFADLLFTTIMPKVYGIGAAIVIFGAMFKILHLPGASAMLGIGLTTEAIIFFISAFEPPHKELDWTKVYPELSEDYSGPTAKPRIKGADTGQGESASQKLDHMLEKAKIGPDLIDSLGKGMQNLATNVKSMSGVSTAAVGTGEYAKNLKTASSSLTNMNKSYSEAMSAMSEMASASKDTKEYHDQVKGVTKNLGALNAVYEMELQDANSHVKAMQRFYANVSTVMESMEKAGKESESFSGELKKLTGNLTSLNTVYGSMLTAMRGGGSSSGGSTQSSQPVGGGSNQGR